MSNKPLAEIKLRRRSDRPCLEATITAHVADQLGAAGDDLLVVERGTTWAAEKAAARGAYFIVTVRRAAAQPAQPTQPVRPEEQDRPALTETLQETIRRLRSERP